MYNGLFINSNQSAVVAEDNLQNTNNSLGESLNRLSSGLEITGAWVNPSGYEIAQTLNATSLGLTQATNNANTGNSLINIASGALATIQGMLGTMQSLATNAANGTNSTDNLAALNSEFVQLSSEITQIADSTNFNGLNLLNAYGSGSIFFSGSTVSGATTTIYGTDGTSTTLANPSTFTGTATAMTLSGTAFDSYSALTGAASETLTSNETVYAGLSGTSTFYTGGQTAITQYLYTTASTSDTIASTSVISGSTTYFFGSASGSTVSGLNTTYQGAETIITNTASSLTSTVADNYSTYANVNNATSTFTFQIGPNSDTTNNQISVAIQGVSAALLGLVSNGNVVSSLNNVSLTNASSALIAISAVQNAINQVAGISGQLGSYQNRVTQILGNLQTENTNTQAAYNNIMDVNFASEMSNFTLLSTLAQSGEAMLSQASLVPQGLLTLLK